MITNNKIKIIPLFTLLLSGCASIQHNVTPSYHLKANGNTGILAFSTQCNLHSGSAMIDFSRDYNFDKTVNKQHIDYRVFFRCNSNKLSKPQLKAIKLPSGYYTLYYFSIICTFFSRCTVIDSINFKPLYFILRPGKVTYLGRIQFIKKKNHKYQIRILKASKYDYPALKEMLPNVKKNQYYRAFSNF